MLLGNDIAYSHEQKTHKYQGIFFKSDTFNNYLDTRVRARFEDFEGEQKILNEFSELIKTALFMELRCHKM